MQGIIPGLEKVVIGIVNKIRQTAHNPDQTFPAQEIGIYTQKTEFLEKYGHNLVRHGGYYPDDAILEANVLGHHVYYMVNFELHRRKLFWVEETLAGMFLQTQLDIEGECLKVPFPCCAFIFTDRSTLEIAERLLKQDETCDIRGEPLEILSTYVIELPAEADASILSVSLLFDTLTGGWPYLISRDLYIEPHDHLETILESHCPEVFPETRDPIFTAAETKQLIHLVFNAILYATTAHLDVIRIPSPVDELNRMIARRGPKKRNKLLHRRNEIAKSQAIDDVFYLPGKIAISSTKHIRDSEKETNGRILENRFMVRGHWRRANPSWKNRSLRWIEPYWKGPDGSAIVEKEYSMKP